MDNEEKLIVLIGRARRLLKGAKRETLGGEAKIEETPHALQKCGAKIRNGTPCKNWGMPNGRCRMHGGKSTGAKTQEGLDRIIKANWKHGRYSAKAIERHRRIRRYFASARAHHDILDTALEIAKELSGEKMNKQNEKTLAEFSEFIEEFQKWCSKANLQGQDLASVVNPKEIEELSFRDRLGLYRLLSEYEAKSRTFLQKLRKAGGIWVEELFARQEEEE